MTHEESYESTRELIDYAFTRKEVEEALQAYRTHVQNWPEDRVRDMMHGFHNKVDLVKAREEEGIRLGLTPEEFQYREDMLRRIPGETEIVYGLLGLTPLLHELIAIREDRIARLRQWLQHYPTDGDVLFKLKLYQQEMNSELELVRVSKEIEQQEASKSSS